jgi:hypothetical protein
MPGGSYKRRNNEAKPERRFPVPALLLFCDS